MVAESALMWRATEIQPLHSMADAGTDMALETGVAARDAPGATRRIWSRETAPPPTGGGAASMESVVPSDPRRERRAAGSVA